MADAISLTLMVASLVALYFLLKGGFKIAPPPAGRPAGLDYLPALPPGPPALQWPDEGRFEVEVMTESRYQPTIRELAGEHGDQSADVRLPALLVPDDVNPYEAHAVAIFVAGRMVGYLTQKDATAFRERLRRLELAGKATACTAAIRGGSLWQGKRLMYAVWLDVEKLG